MAQIGKDNAFDSLGQPAKRALANAGIKTLEQVAQLTETQLKQLHGIGPKTVRQLQEVMIARNLFFSSTSNRFVVDRPTDL